MGMFNFVFQFFLNVITWRKFRELIPCKRLTDRMIMYCTYVFMSYTYVFMYKYIHTYIHTYVYTYISIYLSNYLFMYVSIYI
jgi:hypothetical protein